MAGRADAAAAGEDLDAGDVDGVDGGAVVGEQGREGAAVDLAPVDHGDGLAEEAVAVGQDRVVDLQVLEGLDDGERGAGEDGLLEVVGRVEEADVVVHVEEVGVAEAFDVLCERDGLLDVLVLLVVARPDRVVDEDAVDGRVLVGRDDLLLEHLLADLAEVKVEAVLLARLLGPLGVLEGVRVIGGQKGGQGGLGSVWALNLCEGLADLGEQLLRDRVRENDLAGLGHLLRCHGDCLSRRD